MNTSTTLMLLPIGLAVCASVAETIPNFSARERKNFEISLLLGIAYAASIGGMSTLVGTAPNIIFVGFIQETYGIEISFVDWMKLGVPLAILMLTASWYAITKIVYPVNFVANIETKLQLQNMLSDLGPLGRDEEKGINCFFTSC
jgi:sodium-dependent dicarboxylate transporter 2/3/5